MQSELPFFDSAEAATRHAIEASGKTLKEVAVALWPDKTNDAARTLLANCLNENRPERLTADQHAFIAAFCGRFDWLYYLCHKCSHSRPEPIAPEDQRARLQREFINSVDRLEIIRQQLARNDTKLRVA